MTLTLAVTKAITSLKEAQAKLHLSPTTNPTFFPEWQFPLPELTPAEKKTLDQLKQRYLYYAADGSISEGTVNFIMISPLLEHLGLFDAPYKVRSEKYVQIQIQNEEEILEGRIDALVIKEQLWIILIESKHYGFSVLQGIPQALAYMQADPEPSKPIFALVTTGEDYIFLKTQDNHYAQSYKFTLLSDDANNLYRVAQVMKRIVSSFT